MGWQQIMSKSKRLAQVCAILALPVGISSDPENPADFAFGVYGGAGRYVSLVNGCEVPPESKTNYFREGAAAAFVRVPTKSRSPLVLGMTGGFWRSDIALVGDYVYDENGASALDNHVGSTTYGFVIPSVSIEGEDAGIGVGVLLGRYPTKFERAISYSPHVSGHLRVGRVDGFHFGYSVNENLPLNSGGGNGNIGLGFGVGKGVMMYHGVSLGGFHAVGLTHQFRIPLGNHSALDASFRWSPKEEHASDSEYGFGIGLRRYFGGF